MQTTLRRTILSLSSLLIATTLSTTGFAACVNDGNVSTLAGTAPITGNINGTGVNARFNNPYSLTVDSSGNVFVVDATNYLIRKVTPSGVVTTLAGGAAVSNVYNQDGKGAAATFHDPARIAVDQSGNLFLTEGNNQDIRKITPSGVVTTYAGRIPSSTFKVNLTHPAGITVDKLGNLYVTDDGSVILKITTAGVVTTVAGSAGTKGFVNDTGSAARFNGIDGITIDKDNNLYVADTGNYAIRKITASGVVTTLAGGTNASYSQDGTGSSARFPQPRDVVADLFGNVYVAEPLGYVIRKIITSTGVVSTLAGLSGVGGVRGSADGIRSEARFFLPAGVAVDGLGNVYVADTSNQTIRKIQ